VPFSGPLADLRGGIYGRVSIDRNAGRSVDDQLNVGRTWAARLHVTVSAEYRDDGISASSYAKGKTRPDWQRAMADINAGRLDLLWVWELSRATRDREVWAALIKACQRRKVLLAVDSTVYDTTDPDDAFMLDLLIGMAVRESAVTHKRVMRGVLSSMEAGRPRGKIPFGYVRTYDPGTGALLSQLPDPATAPIVRELFTRVAAGEPIHAIARDFNERGLPTPQADRDTRRGVTAERGGWTGSKIRRQLGNPAFAGYRVHQGAIVGEASWEPLIDAALFATVTNLMADPKRQTHNGVEAKWLLSGILECGVCGAKCRQVSNKGRPAYACHGKNFNNQACVHGRQEPIDGVVVERLLLRLAEPDGLTTLTADNSVAVAEAQAELAALEARLEEFERSAEDPEGISVASLARYQRKYEPLIADARARATPVWIPQAAVELNQGDVDRRWEVLDLPTRRTVVSSLMRVTLRKDTRPRGSHGFDLSRVHIQWRDQV
jgi:site-specific DNA recombinase